MPNTDEMTECEKYDWIMRHGYAIDVREVHPILIKGNWAHKFDNHAEAMQYAINEIYVKEGQ